MPKWPRWQFLKKNIRCLFGFLHSIDSQMIWFDAMSSDFFYPAANFPKLILVLREREGREWGRERERERERVKERERGGRGSDWQFHFHHCGPLVISRKDATMLFRCFTIGVKTFDRLDTAWHPLTLFFLFNCWTTISRPIGHCSFFSSRWQTNFAGRCQCLAVKEEERDTPARPMLSMLVCVRVRLGSLCFLT